MTTEPSVSPEKYDDQSCNCLCSILLQIVILSRQRGAPHKKSRKEIVLMLQGRHNVSEQQPSKGGRGFVRLHSGKIIIQRCGARTKAYDDRTNARCT